ENRRRSLDEMGDRGGGGDEGRGGFGSAHNSLRDRVLDWQVEERLKPFHSQNMANRFYTSFDEEAWGGVRQADYRTAFQAERDRVIHAHAFRKLQSKTQV